MACLAIPNSKSAFWISSGDLLDDACVILLWWTGPIKKVALEEDYFLISNYLREIRVPATWLAKIVEDQGNGTPNITLFFDPATAFGRKVRIVPPYTLWRDEEFTHVAQLLSKLLEKNRGQQNGPDDSNRRSSGSDRAD
jgi:hypothetical protein